MRSSTNKIQLLSRREFLKFSFWSLTGTTIASMGISKYATVFEPSWVEVKAIELKLTRLPLSFEGFKLLQISDIHAGGWMYKKQLSHIIELANAQSADAVIITGDFTSVDLSEQAETKLMLIEQLSKLKAKNGIFAVMGNHDHWTNVKAVRSMLNQSNIIELKNDVARIKEREEYLYFCGLDDYWENHHDLSRVIEKLPANSCAILFVHEPDFGEIAAQTQRFDLQLSGHSHGGQVIIPFIGPPITPPFAKKFPNGLYEENEMKIYTNRGVGMIAPYVRFNCRPEITVFTLRAHS